ncbi:MAG: TIGR04283 family arsenosugar biosynthesis glycosyltransferase [Alphaproteobacteria bacterium]
MISATIAASLERLAGLRAVNGGSAEVVVVDGGSRDGTPETSRALCDRVLVAPRGRAAQMNAGAAVAGGGVLLFLHADTDLPPDADRLIAAALARHDAVWGRFDVAIAGRHPLLPVVATMMNLRSRLSGIATGDQAIFVRRDAFEAVGGFPDIALMEDVAFSAALRRRARPCCLRARVTTSGRRWEKNGALRTVLLMWRLRLAFFLGADPADLARRYGYAPRDG